MIQFPVTGTQESFEITTIQGDDMGVGVGGPTNLELALYAKLEEEAIEFIEEWNVPGTNFRLDAYDPQTKIGYEADGPWHDKDRDEWRDSIICATGHVVEVCRYTQHDLKPWL